MLASGTIQASSSNWSSPLHMVPKSKGAWVPCGDYRALNKITKPDRYPVPDVQNFSVRLAGCSIFSIIDLVRQSFERLQQYGLVINPSKCELGRSQLCFSGHLITAKGISPLPNFVQAIGEFPPPADQKELCEFLSMFNIYHRFIPHCAGYLHPLHTLYLASAQYVWSPECQEAFEFCKSALAKAHCWYIHSMMLQPISHRTLGTKQLGLELSSSLTTSCGRLPSFHVNSDRQRLGTARSTESDRVFTSVAICHFCWFVEGRVFHVYTDHKE